MDKYGARKVAGCFDAKHSVHAGLDARRGCATRTVRGNYRELGLNVSASDSKGAVRAL